MLVIDMLIVYCTVLCCAVIVYCAEWYKDRWVYTEEIEYYYEMSR